MMIAMSWLHFYVCLSYGYDDVISYFAQYKQNKKKETFMPVPDFLIESRYYEYKHFHN